MKKESLNTIDRETGSVRAPIEQPVQQFFIDSERIDIDRYQKKNRLVNRGKQREKLSPLRRGRMRLGDKR